MGNFPVATPQMKMSFSLHRDWKEEEKGKDFYYKVPNTMKGLCSGMCKMLSLPSKGRGSVFKTAQQHSSKKGKGKGRDGEGEE